MKTFVWFVWNLIILAMAILGVWYYNQMIPESLWFGLLSIGFSVSAALQFRRIDREVRRFLW